MNINVKDKLLHNAKLVNKYYDSSKEIMLVFTRMNTRYLKYAIFHILISIF